MGAATSILYGQNDESIDGLIVDSSFSDLEYLIKIIK